MRAENSAGREGPSHPHTLAPSHAPRPLLELDDLRVLFPGFGAPVEAVAGVSLALAAGEIVGLVGESGSGKSLTALAILRLVSPPGRIAGRVVFDGQDLTALPEEAMRLLRGRRIAIVFQDPGAALDPVMTIGAQIAETQRVHGVETRRSSRAAVAAAFSRAALDPALAGRYPHELSGGQRQRAVIALALSAGPDLLLADEPTTALDTTVQASILDLLKRLRDESGLAILLISHDLAVVAETSDRIAVLYAGRIVEEGSAVDLVTAAAHPYTRALWQASPHLGEARAAGSRLPALPGQPPRPGERIPGCPFSPRCPEALPACSAGEPPWVELPGPAGEAGAAHRARCLRVEGKGR